MFQVPLNQQMARACDGEEMLALCTSQARLPARSSMAIKKICCDKESDQIRLPSVMETLIV
jgi:hypothetical protein